MDSENNKLNETNPEEISEQTEKAETVPEENAGAAITPEIISQPVWNVENNNQPPEKKKKFPVPVIIGAVVAALVVVFIILTATHVICLEHKWADATCTQPKTCEYCEKTEGEAKGHKWVEATCKAPKTCSVCNGTEGEKKPHKEKSTVIVAPTMLLPGEEKITCEICGEFIENRTIPQIEVKVEGISLNITADVLVNWYSTILDVKITPLGVKGNCLGYSLKSGSNSGTMIIYFEKQGNDKKVCAVATTFSDRLIPIQMIALLAAEIDPSYDAGDGAVDLLYGVDYENAGIVAHKGVGDSGAELYILATLEYLKTY